MLHLQVVCWDLVLVLACLEGRVDFGSVLAGAGAGSWAWWPGCLNGGKREPVGDVEYDIWLNSGGLLDRDGVNNKEG